MINTIAKTIRKLIHPDFRTGFTGNKALGHILNYDDKIITVSYQVSVREFLCNE